MKIDKGFFKRNPLKDFSTAVLFHVTAPLTLNEESDNIINSVSMQGIDDNERLAKINDEKEQIGQITSAEEIINHMRRSDIVNRGVLCRRAVELQEEVMPAIVKRYYTNRQDSFIECAAVVLYGADDKYLRQLLDDYDKIISPYAKSFVPLLAAMKDFEPDDDFLLGEYEKFCHDYPDESYDQQPLLALYITHGKA